MQTTQSDYFSAYRSLKLTRASNGVLVAEFHTKGGPLTFTAQDHAEFVDAFYRIAQDRANKIVILTGAGAMEKSLATHLPGNTEPEEFDLVILGGGTGRVWRLK